MATPNPLHTLIDTPSFSLTVGASEEDARRYATSLWLIQEKAGRYSGATAKALAPREYKRLLEEIVREVRATLGIAGG